MPFPHPEKVMESQADLFPSFREVSEEKGLRTGRTLLENGTSPESVGEGM